MTKTTKRPMKRKAMHSFRIDDDLQASVRTLAADRDCSVGTIIRDALRAYVAVNGSKGKRGRKTTPHP